ncbi:MAG TPA: FHA domain-containing protein [Chroococcidiopsis sp.]
MITLFLLHPIKQIPVQTWTFDNESTIRIGRSTDNQVILYSAVVSRHHVELRRVGNSWEIVNLGTNGTYLDGKRITQMPVSDGAIIRLARSGPNIQIRIGAEVIKDLPNAISGDRTVTQQRPDYPTMSTEITDAVSEINDKADSPDDERSDEPIRPAGMIPVPSHLQLVPTTFDKDPPGLKGANGAIAVASRPLDLQPVTHLPASGGCAHERGDSPFCPDCGQPRHALQVVGDYHLIKVLGQGEIGITYLAWQQGHSVVIKTVNAVWRNNPQAHAALEFEADILRQINHPRIPHLVDFFWVAGQPYLAMELMSGQTLAQRVSGGPSVSIPQAIAWMIETCQILEYIHSFVPPLLHRGIRPTSLIQQVLPGAPNAIALVDFGVIKAIALGESAPAGTTSYNPPEQLDMGATPAVDLYPLGPLTAYLITGQNPITFYADRGQGYRFYGDAVPGIPSALAQVLTTLAHPQPDQRYANARDAALALRGLALSS